MTIRTPKPTLGRYIYLTLPILSMVQQPNNSQVVKMTYCKCANCQKELRATIILAKQGAAVA